MNDDSGKLNIRQIRREHEAERIVQQSRTAVPSEIYSSAIFMGVKWAFIIFVTLIASRALDGAIGINVLTPEDKTKLANYYVPDYGSHVLTPRKENDTTFVVDVPLTQICSQVNLEIPKGKWLYVLNVTPIGVELPMAKPDRKPLTKFKVGKYGGYLTLNDNGTPLYLMMEEMDRKTGAPSPYAFYGAPLVIVDNVAHLSSEQVGYRASSRQVVYFGVNLYNDGSVKIANGFYRIRFAFVKNKFAR